MMSRLCWFATVIVFPLAIFQADAQNSSGVPIGEISRLHPAFFWDAREVARAIQYGKVEAEKGHTLNDILKRYRQNLTWQRGKKGKAHESFAWFYGLDAIPISLNAYHAATLYEEDTVPASVKSLGAVEFQLEFEVHLESVSHVARYIWEHDRPADEADVTAHKFVLSDDRGHNWFADSESTMEQKSSGTMTFSGVSAIPSFGSSNTTINGNGSLSGNSGSANYDFYANASSTYTRTQFIPWSVERPYYTATYTVRFPIFEEGNPRITRDVKKITLHVITQSGELEVTYNLPAPKK